MKVISVLIALLALCALVSAQWDKDDYEIFELQAALEKDEGEGANFYTFFNLTRSASAIEIRKAYRARSMELHPDKHAGQAGAERRFERLGVINKILRDHRRDRYDHFLTNGFPKWRGTGYFYARYRPGLGSVLVFLAMVTAAIELVIKRVNYARDYKRLHALTTTAKMLAWGPRFRSIEAGLRKSNGNGEPDPLNKGFVVPAEKKVRVPLSGIDVPPLALRQPEQEERAYWDEDEKTVRKAIAGGVASNSADAFGAPKRQIDVLVTRDVDVFIMDPSTKEWTLLDESAAPKPAMTDTWPFSVSRSLLGKFSGAQRTQTPSAESSVETTSLADAATTNGSARSSNKKNKNKKKQQ